MLPRTKNDTVKVFEILANALTDNDALSENETLESLTDKIRNVGEEFLPREQRRISDIETPIGSGQSVYVIASQHRKDKHLSFRTTTR